MTDTSTLRILEPAPGVFAYYDGRIAGRRLHGAQSNWLDDGAYSLGVASYAIVAGDAAIVYDSHISLDHATAVRRHLEALGVRRFTLVLSHWHKDHIAGNAVFADSVIIAGQRTANMLGERRADIERADPPISPLVMPTTVFDGRLRLMLDGEPIELLPFEIHSSDGVVLHLPARRLLLVGDCVEDTVTYVSEAGQIGVHIAELDRLASLDFDRFLPAHGDPDRIAAGGYDRSLIAANRDYLLRMTKAGGAINPDLAGFVAEDIAAGRVSYFAPYEEVHASNIAAVARAVAGAATIDD